MKKTIFYLLLSSFLIAETPTANQLQEAFPVLKQYQVSISDIVEQDSLYIGKGSVATQQGRRQIDFFVTKDMETILFGQAFDKQGERLFIPIDMAKIEKDAAFKMGSGSNKYYVFTDPECPYCHKMKKALKDLEKEGTFYFYLYPLSFHKNAMDMSVYIISEERKKRGKGWQAALEIAEGKDSYIEGVKKVKPKDIAEYKAAIKLNMTYGDNLGVSGTPSVFDDKGNAVDWVGLLKQRP